MPSPTFCIAGAGLTGGRAAAALRERGFDGRLVLVGAESEPPYERPPLSKAYLRGELPLAKLLLRSPQSYSELAIEWHPQTTASAIDLHQRKLRLANGEPLAFDRLLLATGARPRNLDIPGSGLAGVVTYRTLADADSLRQELERRPQVVVVGGGFLGTELAVAARRRGCQVTVLEAGDALVAPLGPLVSSYCLDLHREAGVEVILQQTAIRFRGESRVEAVELSGGHWLPCDLALICVGAEPNSQLAQKAGLATDPGVLVGDRCQTSSEAVFAAGDVASWWSPRWQRRLRVEHYDNAHQQGLFAAGAMLGVAAAYDPVPYFWTEQYEALIQQVGIVGGPTEALLRGDPQSGQFTVFYLAEGMLSGCVAVNRFPDLAAARRLITARVGVSRELLADPQLDLRAWSLEAAEAAGGA